MGPSDTAHNGLFEIDRYFFMFILFVFVEVEKQFRA